MAQYLHDVPNGDPSQCQYESGHGTKYCMEHHKFGNLAVRPPTSKEVEKTAAKAKAQSAHAEKQKKLQEFVDRQKLDKIVLTSNRKDVQTLAGIPWNNFTASMKKSFMKDNKIAIPQTMRNNTDLGKVVANHLNGDEITIAVASTAAKKKKAADVPTFITQMMGTMIRLINTIVGCQAAYKATKGTNDREDQDTQKPKAAAWETMTQYYNSEEERLNEICPSVAYLLVGLGIPDDAGHYYDPLTAIEMKEATEYLNAQYRMARNAKSQKSGCHGGIAAHVNGKKWLLYYDHLLQEEKNADLSTYAFPLLPTNVVRTSTDSITPKRRKLRQHSSSASDRSFLTTINSGGDSTTVSGATIGAMSAVEVRMTNLNSNENIVQSMRATTELSRLKAERNRLDKKYVQLGGDYIAAKKSGEKRKTKELKLERNGVKSELRMAEKNYAALKEKLGYESPDCSSASSPSEDEDSN
jgi:hypothetical protein